MPAADTLAIICNWNKRDDLDRCLTTLRASSPEGLFDTVVVDNASTDDSVAMVREKHPWARVHVNPENLGGTGGFNAGMRIALAEGYDYYWLMDNDIVVHRGAFEALRKTMDGDRRIGLVGSRVLYLEDPEVTQEIGGRVEWSSGRLLQMDKDATDRDARLNDVDFASACSLFARTAAARQAGIWDPGYFVTFDDVDWGVRMKRAGWRVVASSEAVVEHASFFSRRPKQGLVTCYYSVRNALYFFRRHNGRARNLRLMFHVFRRFLGDAALYRRAGEHGQATALRAAMGDFFRRRMGKCPHAIDFATKADDATFPADLAKGKKKLLLIATTSEELVKNYLAKLKERAPEADVDVFVNADDKELLEMDVPRKMIVTFRSLAQRLAFLARSAGRYDGVFASSVARSHLFEELIPWSCRLDADGRVVHAQRGGALGLLRKASIRVGSALVALPMAVAGAFWPLGRPNYFTFDDPPLLPPTGLHGVEGEGSSRDATPRKRGALAFAKAAANHAIGLLATLIVSPPLALYSAWEKRRSRSTR
jgi:GT2 family glycosyltransferase